VRRHETDYVSLVAGLLFLVVAAVHVAAGSTDTELDVRWMIPTLLLLLGIVGLMGAVRGSRPQAVAVPGPMPSAPTDAQDGSEDETEVLPRDEGTPRT
jgi:hypothetical protein